MVIITAASVYVILTSTCIFVHPRSYSIHGFETTSMQLVIKSLSAQRLVEQKIIWYALKLLSYRSECTVYLCVLSRRAFLTAARCTSLSGQLQLGVLDFYIGNLLSSDTGNSVYYLLVYTRTEFWYSSTSVITDTAKRKQRHLHLVIWEKQWHLNTLCHMATTISNHCTEQLDHMINKVLNMVNKFMYANVQTLRLT